MRIMKIRTRRVPGLYQLFCEKISVYFFFLYCTANITITAAISSTPAEIPSTRAVGKFH